jgi:hypothetical protein
MGNCYPAFAQDDIGVPGVKDILRGPQPVAEGRTEVPFQHHRSPGLGRSFQEWIILHVSRANLEDVGCFGHRIDLIHVHDFGDDRNSGLFFCDLQKTQALLSQLKKFWPTIRESQRLESPSAQKMRPRLFHRLRCCDNHFLVLYGVWAGKNRDQRPSEFHPRDANDRLVIRRSFRCKRNLCLQVLGGYVLARESVLNLHKYP